MKVINNVTETVRDDLSETLRKGSRLSIAAACFSIYAYQELRKQLDSVEQVRFIFTSPTFVQEKTPKTKHEFYIPRLSRERSLYGTEFEIKLRNELTQRAIAKECADWIRKKVTFKSNTTPDLMAGFLTVDESTYMPISGFTTVDLGCERGNNIYNIVTRTESFENGRQFIRLFDEIWQDEGKLQDVTDIVLESITTAYRENSPDFIYFYTLYNIFNEFLEDISEDVLPNEATGFKQSKIWNMLYNFQRDAVLAIISKLEKYKKYAVDFISGRALREMEPAAKMYAKIVALSNAAVKGEEIPQNQQVSVTDAMDVMIRWFCLLFGNQFSPDDVLDGYPVDRLMHDIALALMAVQTQTTEILSEFPTKAAKEPASPPKTAEAEEIPLF
mgnify:CR=1 FL=1